MPAGSLATAGHRIGLAMAKAVGIGTSSVQRVRCGHGFRLHRAYWFKLFSDPQFAVGLREITGPDVDSLDHATVLSVDEKSQIQVLDGTQPRLPPRNGRAGRMTHDHRFRGVTTLFAAFNAPEGQEAAQRLKHRRHPR
jgi:hypothetical protein